MTTYFKRVLFSVLCVIAFDSNAQEKPVYLRNLQVVSDDLSIGYGGYNEEFDAYYNPYLISIADTLPMDGFGENFVSLFEVSPNERYLYMESISMGWVYNSDEDSILHDRWECVLYGIEERGIVFTGRFDCGDHWNEHQLWMDGERIVFDGSGNGDEDVRGLTFFDDSGKYWIQYDANGLIEETGQVDPVFGCQMPVGRQAFYKDHKLYKTIDHSNWLPAFADGCHEIIQEQVVNEYFPGGELRSTKMFQNSYEGDSYETGVWAEYYARGELVVSFDKGLRYNPTLYNNSFLGPYLRAGVVTGVANEVEFNIVFDLHGFDCGAPDCYQTDVSFEFPFSDTVRFPERLPFQLHEHGCVDERLFEGNFELQSAGKDVVIYYFRPHSAVMVLCSSPIQGEFIYFFEDVNPDEITEETLSGFIEAAYEDESKQPYLTRAMRSY